jgi:hypothetical protein
MKKKKTKMGRPTLKEENRRTSFVTVRLKSSELKELEQDSKAEGLSLSGYLIKCWKNARQ